MMLFFSCHFLNPHTCFVHIGLFMEFTSKQNQCYWTQWQNSSKQDTHNFIVTIMSSNKSYYNNINNNNSNNRFYTLFCNYPYDDSVDIDWRRSQIKKKFPSMYLRMQFNIKYYTKIDNLNVHYIDAKTNNDYLFFMTKIVHIKLIFLFFCIDMFNNALLRLQMFMHRYLLSLHNFVNLCIF